MLHIVNLNDFQYYKHIFNKRTRDVVLFLSETGRNYKSGRERQRENYANYLPFIFVQIAFSSLCPVYTVEQKTTEAEENQLNEPDSNIVSQEIIKKEGPQNEVCMCLSTS